MMQNLRNTLLTATLGVFWCGLAASATLAQEVDLSEVGHTRGEAEAPIAVVEFGDSVRLLNHREGTFLSVVAPGVGEAAECWIVLVASVLSAWTM